MTVIERADAIVAEWRMSRGWRRMLTDADCLDLQRRLAEVLAGDPVRQRAELVVAIQQGPLAPQDILDHDRQVNLAIRALHQALRDTGHVCLLCEDEPRYAVPSPHTLRGRGAGGGG